MLGNTAIEIVPQAKKARITLAKIDPNDYSVPLLGFGQLLNLHTKESIQQMREYYYSGGKPSGETASGSEIRRFRITLSDYRASWDYVSNFWNVHSKPHSSKKTPGLTSTTYRCTMNNDQKGGKRPREVIIRQTQKHISGKCSEIKMIVDMFEHEQIVVITHLGKHNSEFHGMTACDQKWHPPVTKAVIKADALKWGVTNVWQNIRQNPDYKTLPGIEFFVYDDVYNAAKDGTRDFGLPRTELDICKLVSAINEFTGYHCSLFAMQENHYGIFFTSEAQLRHLALDGYLCLMDSTNNAAQKDWKLITVYIKTRSGIWIPAFQAFVFKENQETLKEFLNLGLTMVQKLQDNQGKYLNWEPRYFITDKTYTEMGSISAVFGANTDVLNCVVHTRRTFMRKISKTEFKVYEEMTKALYTPSKIVFEEAISKAISLCQKNENMNMEKYIMDNWLKKPDSYGVEKWAMWARQHSPILLQHNTTLAVENYHRCIKLSEVSCDSFYKCFIKLKNTLENKLQQIEKIQYRVDYKVSTLGEIYPDIQRFSYAFEQLLIAEITAGFNLNQEGEAPKHKLLDPRNIKNCDCCNFTRKYLLPCKHVFQLDQLSVYSTMTKDLWDHFHSIFQESGYEVYYKFCKVLVDVEEAEPILTAERLQCFSTLELAKEFIFRQTDSNNGNYVKFLDTVIRKTLDFLELAKNAPKVDAEMEEKLKALIIVIILSD